VVRLYTGDQGLISGYCAIMGEGGREGEEKEDDDGEKTVS